MTSRAILAAITLWTIAMATTFPTSLQALDNLGPTASMGGSHSSLHTDVNDTVEALQAKVGINDSAVTTSHDYRIAALEIRVAGFQKVRALSAVETAAQTRTVDVDEGITNTVEANQDFVLNFTGPDDAAHGSVISVYVYNDNLFEQAVDVTTDLEETAGAPVVITCPPGGTTVIRVLWDGKGMWLLTAPFTVTGDRRPAAT